MQFDEAYYLAKNPDVAQAVSQGATTALQHYQQLGWKEGRDPSPWFNTAYYLAKNPDVKAAGVDPFAHFQQFGASEGRDSSALFDTRYYLARNPDVAAAVKAGTGTAINHYLAFGAAEGRLPNQTFAQRFNAAAYLSANPDVAMAVAAGQTSALTHFLSYGVKEGRGGAGVDLSSFTRVVTGVVSDGRIANATGFIDLNGNGKQDPGEPAITSDAQGNFTYTDLPTGAIVFTTGTDLSTGKAIGAPLSTPIGGAIADPINTLIAAAVAQGASVATATAEIAQALGLPAGTDLSNYDPIAAARSATDPAAAAAAVQAQAAAVKLATLMNTEAAAIAAAGSGTLSASDAQAAVVASLANLLTSAKGTVDLTDKSIVQSTFDSAAGSFSSPALTTALTGVDGAVGSLVAGANKQVDAAISDPTQVEADLASIANAETVAARDSDLVATSVLGGRIAPGLGDSLIASLTGDIATEKSKNPHPGGILDPVTGTALPTSGGLANGGHAPVTTRVTAPSATQITVPGFAAGATYTLANDGKTLAQVAANLLKLSKLRALSTQATASSLDDVGFSLSDQFSSVYTPWNGTLTLPIRSEQAAPKLTERLAPGLTGAFDQVLLTEPLAGAGDQPLPPSDTAIVYTDVNGATQEIDGSFGTLSAAAAALANAVGGSAAVATATVPTGSAGSVQIGSTQFTADPGLTPGVNTMFGTISLLGGMMGAGDNVAVITFSDGSVKRVRAAASSFASLDDLGTALAAAIPGGVYAGGVLGHTYSVTAVSVGTQVFTADPAVKLTTTSGPPVWSLADPGGVLPAGTRFTALVGTQTFTVTSTAGQAIGDVGLALAQAVGGSYDATAKTVTFPVADVGLGIKVAVTNVGAVTLGSAGSFTGIVPLATVANADFAEGDRIDLRDAAGNQLAVPKTGVALGDISSNAGSLSDAITWVYGNAKGSGTPLADNGVASFGFGGRSYLLVDRDPAWSGTATYDASDLLFDVTGGTAPIDGSGNVTAFDNPAAVLAASQSGDVLTLSGPMGAAFAVSADLSGSTPVLFGLTKDLTTTTALPIAGLSGATVHSLVFGDQPVFAMLGDAGGQSVTQTTPSPFVSAVVLGKAYGATIDLGGADTLSGFDASNGNTKGLRIVIGGDANLAANIGGVVRAATFPSKPVVLAEQYDRTTNTIGTGDDLLLRLPGPSSAGSTTAAADLIVTAAWRDNPTLTINGTGLATTITLSYALS